MTTKRSQTNLPSITITREMLDKVRLDRAKTKLKQAGDDRTGICVVCKGTVVAKVTREYRGDPMRQIIGPGGRDQMTTVHHGFHCKQCGLKYEFIPELVHHQV